MKQKFLILLLFLFLTACKADRVTIEEYKVLPDRIMVSYGTEEVGEPNLLETDFAIIYSAGETYYYVDSTYYIPNEDGTFALIDTDYDRNTGYIMNINKTILDIDVYEYLNYAVNKTYGPIFYSPRHQYRDDDIRIVLHDENPVTLSFRLYGVNEPYIFHVDVLRDDEYVIPEYTLYSDTVTDQLYNRTDFLTKIDEYTLQGENEGYIFTLHLDSLTYETDINDTHYVYDLTTDIMCKTANDITVCDPDGYTSDNQFKLHSEFYWYYIDVVGSDIHSDIIQTTYQYHRYVSDGPLVEK